MFPPTSPPSSSQLTRQPRLASRANESPSGRRCQPLTGLSASIALLARKIDFAGDSVTLRQFHDKEARVGKVLVLVGVIAASVALVGTALANHSWGSYHWSRTANPLTLSVGNNLSSTWDPYLTGAISDWNNSAFVNLSDVDNTKDPVSCSPTSGRIEACNAAYGNTNWLGIAQIWVSGGHITQATTKVNDTYFNTTTYNTPAWRRLVMCQEIAHDFGLAHQDETHNNANLGSCMDYTNDPDGGLGGASSTDESNEHPNAHDYAQLKTIYEQLDDVSGSGGTGCPGKSKKCRSGLDKAPPFSQASRANGSVYFDDLGNGKHRVTHVFWTPFGE